MTGKERAGSTGAFVYSGSGKVQSKTASACQRLCVKEARAIQFCLAKNGYNERWCQRTIAHWQKCCDNANAVDLAAKSESEAKPDSGPGNAVEAS